MRKSVALGELKTPGSVKRLEDFVRELYFLANRPEVTDTDPDTVLEGDKGQFMLLNTNSVLVLLENTDGDVAWEVYGAAENTPAQITADQNDYAPGAYEFLRLATDASRTVTGIANGFKSRRLWVINVGSFDLVLANESASSTAANRIITGTGGNLTVAADANAFLWYDNTSTRWRVLT